MSEQAIDEPSPLAFVGEEDFASVDIEGPIRGNSHVACTELWQNFGQAERIAEAGEGRSGAASLRPSWGNLQLSLPSRRSCSTLWAD